MDSSNPVTERLARALRHWDRIGDHVVRALLSPFPPLKDGSRALASLRKRRRDGHADAPVASRRSGPTTSGAPTPRILIAGNAGHADIPLHAPGSGLMGILLVMLGQTVGFPVPEGGAGALAGALARRCESLGGDIHYVRRSLQIDVQHGRAAGVARPTANASSPARPSSPMWSHRTSTAASCLPRTCRSDRQGHEVVRAGPRHGQGRLGPRRQRAWARRRWTTRHLPHR